MVMQACVRTLGELVAKNAIDDPQLVSAEEAQWLGARAYSELQLLTIHVTTFR